jgi:hypothetical protein
VKYFLYFSIRTFLSVCTVSNTAVLYLLLLFVVVVVVSCRRPYLPDTSLETTVISTEQSFKFHTAVLSVLCVTFQV